VDSRGMVRELLATQAPDEATATRILESAFGNDGRLVYADGKWSLCHADGAIASATPHVAHPESDRVLLFVQGGRRARGEPFRLCNVSALRLSGDEVVAACGGDAAEGPYGSRLRRATLEMLDGAIPVIHDPPGALKALEEWLGEPVAVPISLRRLAQERVGLSASHELESLVARLGLPWRGVDDPLEQADTLDACLQALRRPGETLHDLRIGHGNHVQPLDWSQFAFNREFLRRIPRAPGTYRFFDARGKLLYVGKSKNLHQRVNSYFREEGRARAPRVQRLLKAVHRIEYESSGSDLEALLREAELIRRENPERNVQRNVHPKKGRASRLRAILILEPSAPPSVLRAYLIRDGRLVDRVPIGPRGGGLKRIERILEDRFFSTPDGPTTVEGPDLDVEMVVRWLAANRDRVVVFDPTELKTSREVIDRLYFSLRQGSPFDPDGSPIINR
jgi:hypothetical protein